METALVLDGFDAADPKYGLEDGTLKKLFNCVRSVLRDEQDELTVNEASDIIAKLCNEPGIEMIDDKVKRLLSEHVKRLSGFIPNGGVNMLVKYLIQWRDYTRALVQLKEMFRPFNEYIKETTTENADTIRQLDSQELALSVWEVSMVEPMRQALQTQLLLELEQEDWQDRVKNVQAVIETFTEADPKLLLYERAMETAYLEDVKARCRKHSACYTLVKGSDSGQEYPAVFIGYLAGVLKVMEEEKMRCEMALHERSASKVKKLCFQHMLIDNVTRYKDQFKRLLTNSYGRVREPEQLKEQGDDDTIQDVMSCIKKVVDEHQRETKK